MAIQKAHATRRAEALKKHPRLWLDDGSLGFGVIHPPSEPARVATIDTYPDTVYSCRYRDPGLPIGPAVALLVERDTGLATGRDVHSNALFPLVGRSFNTLSELADAIAALGFAVVTTHSGGTYYRIR